MFVKQKTETAAPILNVTTLMERYIILECYRLYFIALRLRGRRWSSTEHKVPSLS